MRNILLLLFLFNTYLLIAQKHITGPLIAQVDKDGFYTNYVNKMGKIVIAGLGAGQDFPYVIGSLDSVVAPARPAKLYHNSSSWSFINIKGEFIHKEGEDDFYEIGRIKDCYIVYKIIDKEWKIGIVDFYGRTVAPCQYKGLRNAFEYRSNWSLVPIKRAKKWGALNQKGEDIIPFKYDSIVETSEHFLVYQGDSLFYLFNAEGKLLLTSKSSFGHLYQIYDKTFQQVKVDGSAGIIMNDGRWLISPEEGYSWFNTDMCDYVIVGGKYFNNNGPFRRSLKYALFDKGGQQILPPIYDDIKIQGRDFIIPSLFDSISKTNKYGLVSVTGKQLLPIEFQEIELKNGWIILSKSDSMGNYLQALYSRTLVNYIPFKYKKIIPEVTKNFIAVQDPKSNKFGAIDTSGGMLLDFKFDAPFRFDCYPQRNYAFTMYNNKNVIINEKGDVLYFVPDDKDIVSFKYPFFITEMYKAHHHFEERSFGAWSIGGRKLINCYDHHIRLFVDKFGNIMFSKPRELDDNFLIMDTSGTTRNLTTNNPKYNPATFNGVSFLTQGSLIVVCSECYIKEMGKDVLVNFRGGKAAIITGINTALIPNFFQWRLNKRILMVMQRYRYRGNNIHTVLPNERPILWLEKKMKHMKKVNIDEYFKK